MSQTPHADLQFRALCLLLDLERLGQLPGWGGVAEAVRADVLHSVRVIAGARQAEELSAVAIDPIGVREKPWKLFPVSEEEVSVRAQEICADARVVSAYGFVGAGKRLLGALHLSEDFRAHAYERLEQLWRAAQRALGSGAAVGAEAPSAPPAAPAAPAAPAPPATPATPAPPAASAPVVEEAHPADVLSQAAAMMTPPVPAASAASPTTPETPNALAEALAESGADSEPPAPAVASAEAVGASAKARAKRALKAKVKTSRKKAPAAVEDVAAAVVEPSASEEEAPKVH